MLGTQAILPTSEGTFKLGAYNVGSDNEAYINPLTLAADTGNSANTVLNPKWVNKSGVDMPAGSIGAVSQYTESGQTQKYDSATHFKFIAAQTAANDSYGTAKTAYETQVTAYNTAAAAWNTDKKGDIMAAVRIYPDT